MWNIVLGGIPVKRWAFYAGLLIAGSASPVRVGLVAGGSMAPSFHNGQPYLFTPTPYVVGQVRKGDVVVFRHEGNLFLKRVLAGPGETVHVLRYQDGTEDVLPAWKVRRWRSMGAHPWASHLKLVRLTVPSGEMYVVGDNVDGSVDSRSFGLVPLAALEGKVLQAPPPSDRWQTLATTDLVSVS